MKMIRLSICPIYKRLLHLCNKIENIKYKFLYFIFYYNNIYAKYRKIVLWMWWQC